MQVSKKFNRLERIICTLDEQEIRTACRQFAEKAGGIPKDYPDLTEIFLNDDETEYILRMIWKFEEALAGESDECSK